MLSKIVAPVLLFRHHYQRRTDNKERSITQQVNTRLPLPQSWNLFSPSSIQPSACQNCLFSMTCSKTFFPHTFVTNRLSLHLISSGHVYLAKLHPPEIYIIIRQVRTLAPWRIQSIIYL